MAKLLTKHALKRMNQRGGNMGAADLAYWHGDLSIPAGNGCEWLRMSFARAANLIANGFPVKLVNDAERLNLLLGADGSIVTVVMKHPGRRVRQGQSTRQNWSRA
jgi:hypothetical protein